MGNVISPGISFTITPPFRRPSIENPTLASIRALQQVEKAQRDAECVARVAQKFLEQVQQQANRYRIQAQLRQEKADHAAARVAEETVQLRSQMEEAARAARHARGLTLAASHASREEAAILVREAQEERQHAQKIREEAEESIAAAKEEAEKAQRAADEENHEAEAAKALAQKMANTIEQETRKAMEAKKETERRLGEDIQPVGIPSPCSQALASSYPTSNAITGDVISWLFGGRSEGANPTTHVIEARQNAERARKEAEAAAQAARDLAAVIKKRADEDRKQARLCQEEADRAAAQAAEEMAQMRARTVEAAKEDIEKLAQEAKEERKRLQQMRDNTEKAMQAAKEESERAQQAADEQRREAKATKAQAEQVSRTAAWAGEIKRANEARLNAERRLKEGIRPVVTPSPEEVAAARQCIQYREDCFHFAIAGIFGSGKSSLVNAFRGLHNRDVGAAAVGVMETSLKTTRYHDANPDNPYVWYDVPCAGTLKCRDWQYFNDQGLYVFDCIIVLFDSRFTATDLAIIANARQFQIPTYIVRSKADQHIRNLMMEMGYDSEGDEDENIERRNKLYKTAREQFIEKTRKIVRDNLDDANFEDQRVYIVSSGSLLSIVTGSRPKRAIDEVELLIDLGSEAHARRKARFVVG